MDENDFTPITHARYFCANVTDYTGFSLQTVWNTNSLKYSKKNMEEIAREAPLPVGSTCEFKLHRTVDGNWLRLNCQSREWSRTLIEVKVGAIQRDDIQVVDDIIQVLGKLLPTFTADVCKNLLDQAFRLLSHTPDTKASTPSSTSVQVPTCDYRQAVERMAKVMEIGANIKRLQIEIESKKMEVLELQREARRLLQDVPN